MRLVLLAFQGEYVLVIIGANLYGVMDIKALSD